MAKNTTTGSKWKYRQMEGTQFRVDWSTGRREYKTKRGKWRKVRPGQLF